LLLLLLLLLVVVVAVVMVAAMWGMCFVCVCVCWCVLVCVCACVVCVCVCVCVVCSVSCVSKVGLTRDLQPLACAVAHCLALPSALPRSWMRLPLPALKRGPCRLALHRNIVTRSRKRPTAHLHSCAPQCVRLPDRPLGPSSSLADRSYQQRRLFDDDEDAFNTAKQTNMSVVAGFFMALVVNAVVVVFGCGTEVARMTRLLQGPQLF
jgi:hypothetical protein